MITVSDVSLSFGERALFKEVNLKFTPGNCYGIIGANGAGKSTFLRLLSGELEKDKGEIIIPKNQRMAVLKQDHFEFEEIRVLDTVIMGYTKLYSIMKERENVYAKEDFTEADGIRASELEGEFSEIGGWEAEAQAAVLLSGLGLTENHHEKLMKELDGGQKVRVLLAQAIFGNPDILLLDEPTNGLDLESINWLEEYLVNFPNTVIVVSHDRHFLNTVCTHVCDIDFARIQMFSGNYDFWYQMSKMVSQQQKDQARKREEKAKDLKDFIQRFSANASKSRQATSRKKILEKLEIDDWQVSSRRFPYVGFKSDRELGNNVLRVEKLNKNFEGEQVLKDFSIIVNRGDKIAFVGHEHLAKSLFFQIISGDDKADSGDFYWGQTTSLSYLPKDNTHLFNQDMPITDWLKQYANQDDETYVRSFLGRMLFSGDEALKSVTVLSGGEKVRCMLSRLMLSGANILILDEPTNHLDLESINALNNGLIEFNGVILFNSHDHEFVNSIANRIIEFTPSGIIDRCMSFDDYMTDAHVKSIRDEMYHGHVIAEL